jgi:predicted alpha/beta superfamily hydrolase
MRSFRSRSYVHPVRSLSWPGPFVGPLLAACVALGCGGAGDPVNTGGTGGTGGAGGGAGGGASGGAGGGGGQGGMEQPPSELAPLLEQLRADPAGKRLALSQEFGFPVPVLEEGVLGYLVVADLDSLPLVAGDFDGWSGVPLAADDGFKWAVIPAKPSEGYKLTNGTLFVADPWSRSYRYDDFGELSLVHPMPGAPAHLDRHFGVEGGGLEPRTVRAWVPAESATHVLYLHDGQNLFDPNAIWGGWRLGEVAPAGMLLVGIDNTPARMDEYTHVEDFVFGEAMGGGADLYATLIHEGVRPLVSKTYGEPPVVGVMGSSLGGLVSLHLADRAPSEFAFAASLSGTLGWGSIGPSTTNETMMQRYAAAGHRDTVLYVDSGGGGTSCADVDGDGTNDDDPSSADNYCENAQLRDTLLGLGYVDGDDLFYLHDPDAPHNEAAWAARVGTPLGIFAGL